MKSSVYAAWYAHRTHCRPLDDEQFLDAMEAIATPRVCLVSSATLADNLAAVAAIPLDPKGYGRMAPRRPLDVRRLIAAGALTTNPGVCNGRA